MNGYQLLNEVGSGGTLSSLFTILSLFTEDVKISWTEGDEEDRDSLRPPHMEEGLSDWDVPQLNLEGRRSSESGPALHSRERSRSPSQASTASATRTTIHGRLPPHAPSSSSRASTFRPPTPGAGSRYSLEPSRVLQGTVARAAEDTTLAVIPAEAFRRVTKKFPKASAHIVQGMFACLQLVSLFVTLAL